jgi:hypothetical protein
LIAQIWPRFRFCQQGCAGFTATGNWRRWTTYNHYCNNSSALIPNVRKLGVLVAKFKARLTLVVQHAFDSILLLSSYGTQVYLGKTEEAAAHFAGLGYPCPVDWNPADRKSGFTSDYSIASSDSYPLQIYWKLLVSRLLQIFGMPHPCQVHHSRRPTTTLTAGHPAAA